MENDQIIRMAREADYANSPLPEFLERFATLVAAHEREECAALCERVEAEARSLWDMRGSQCAAAIRARGVA